MIRGAAKWILEMSTPKLLNFSKIISSWPTPSIPLWNWSTAYSHIAALKPVFHEEALSPQFCSIFIPNVLVMNHMDDKAIPTSSDPFKASLNLQKHHLLMARTSTNIGDFKSTRPNIPNDIYHQTSTIFACQSVILISGNNPFGSRYTNT